MESIDAQWIISIAMIIHNFHTVIDRFHLFSIDFYNLGWILVDFMYMTVSSIDFQWISVILGVFRSN